MNKKIASIICLSIVLIFCVPSVPVLADSDIRLFTTESVDGYFEGNFTFDNNSVSRSDIASSLFLDFDSLSSNDQDNYITTLSSLPSHSDNYLVFSAGNSVFLYDFDSVVTFVSETSGFGGNTGRVLALSMDSFSGSYYSCTIGSTSWSSGVTFSSRFASGLCYFYFDSISLVKLLYTPLDLYSRVEADITNLELSDRSLRMYVSIYNGNSFGFTNYAGDSLPFYNGSEVIDPDAPVVESNINHMYFNSCQLGFCEPYGVSNFSSFGGAYFYAKYSVDEWIRNHITDYSLYFYATAYVDSRQYSGNIEVRLDNDGCITIPFSDIFSTDGGVVSEGFLAYISPNLVEQSFYDTSLFSVNKEQVQSFVEQRNTMSQDDWDIFWQDLYNLNSGQLVGNLGFGAIGYLSNNLSVLLNDVISPSIINAINNHTNFKIHVNCYLKDNSGNISGTVGKMFDLKVGNNFSTNNDGLTNNNPFIETDLPSDYVPSIISDNNGYSLSGIGNNNQIVNFSSPDQVKLFIDNGLKDFVVWYNTDPSVGNAAHSFWNNMGIFKDNPATSLYQQYFGFLPDDFKDLILGACGIGIVGGAFCILRKKLT